MKKVSIKDIAAEVKLSKTTVSFILNGKGEANNISKETIKRVLRVAQKLNYQPNYFAKSLSLGKSNTIGLIIPHITDPFFSEIATIIETIAAEHEYTVVYGSTNEDTDREKKLINTFIQKQVDGLIIASSLLNENDILNLQKAKYPFILIDRYYSKLNTSYVVVENELGSYSIVNSLIKKKRKCIAVITASRYLNLMQERENGYKRALNEHNIPFNKELIKEVDLNDIESCVYKAIAELSSSYPQLDAIFFTTHYMVPYGLKYLKEKNKTIPNDIAICCFGDSTDLKFFVPSITAIPMPAKQIGKEAIRILLKEISSNSDYIEQIKLPVNIIGRESW